jgi:hypothetical protein
MSNCSAVRLYWQMKRPTAVFRSCIDTQRPGSSIKAPSIRRLWWTPCNARHSLMLRICTSGDHQNHARPGVPTAPPTDRFTTQPPFLPAVPPLAHEDPVPKDAKRTAKSRLQLPLPRQLPSLLDLVGIDVAETPCGPQKPWNGHHPNHRRVLRPRGIPRLDYGLPRDVGKSTWA